MKVPPHKEEPLFLVISSYTPEGGDSPRFFFFLTAVGRGPRLPNLTSFSHSHHQPCPSHRHFPCHFSLPPLPLHPHSRPATSLTSAPDISPLDFLLYSLNCTAGPFPLIFFLSSSSPQQPAQAAAQPSSDQPPEHSISETHRAPPFWIFFFLSRWTQASLPPSALRSS
ncbi:hypothetical protein POPTR_001G063309v4 [Populus trichocarpa]|uniref:Uncharacterized protein n=1 Tax=Populus trichocarpa TaxID=3694 RepID=A0ACC0THZ9_POPTR|nr:hypothetical protein POPTR_001G063309v4 [Populus trichocarpa]